jgi:hypothetical protein
MDQNQLRRRSHLFTVRLWAEEIGDGQTEWRGRVQQVTSGEAYYFRDWPTLIAHLLKMLNMPARAGDMNAKVKLENTAGQEEL